MRAVNVHCRMVTNATKLKRIETVTFMLASAQVREFVRKWMANPDWTDAYFEEDVTNDDIYHDRESGRWIAYERLEVILGKDGARKALRNRWYNFKPG